MFTLGVTLGAFVPLLIGGGTEHTLLMYGSRQPELLAALLGRAVRTWARGSLLLMLGLFVLSRVTTVPVEIVVLIGGGLVAGINNPLVASYARSVGRITPAWVALLAGRALFLGYLLVVGDRLTLLNACSAYAASHGASTMILFAVLGRRLRMTFRTSSVERTGGMARAFWVTQITDMLFNRVDVIVLTLSTGWGELGLYGVGQRLVGMANLVPSAVHTVVLPGFHRAAPCLEELGRQFRIAQAWLFLGGMSAAGVLIFHASSVEVALFSDAYAGVHWVIALMSFSVATNFIGYAHSMTLDAAGRVRMRFRCRVVGLLALVGLLAVLVPRAGAVGAAAALATAQAIYLAGLILASRTVLNRSEQVSKIGRYGLLASVVPGVLTQPVVVGLDPGMWLLVLGVIAHLAATVVAAWLLHRRDPVRIAASRD